MRDYRDYSTILETVIKRTSQVGAEGHADYRDYRDYSFFEGNTQMEGNEKSCVKNFFDESRNVMSVPFSPVISVISVIRDGAGDVTHSYAESARDCTLRGARAVLGKQRGQEADRLGDRGDRAVDNFTDKSHYRKELKGRERLTMGHRAKSDWG